MSITKETIKKPWFVVLIVISVALIIWAASLINCEILTKKYYVDFEYAYKGNTMLGDMKYFKVLSCNGQNSRVYYVSENMESGDVLTFEKQDGEWVEVKWECIWAASGNASEVVYPYWWHFIYGGL